MPWNLRISFPITCNCGGQLCNGWIIVWMNTNIDVVRADECLEYAPLPLDIRHSSNNWLAHQATHKPFECHHLAPECPTRLVNRAVKYWYPSMVHPNSLAGFFRISSVWCVHCETITITIDLFRYNVTAEQTSVWSNTECLPGISPFEKYSSSLQSIAPDVQTRQTPFPFYRFLSIDTRWGTFRRVRNTSRRDWPYKCNRSHSMHSEKGLNRNQFATIYNGCALVDSPKNCARPGSASTFHSSDWNACNRYQLHQTVADIDSKSCHNIASVADCAVGLPAGFWRRVHHTQCWSETPWTHHAVSRIEKYNRQSPPSTNVQYAALQCWNWIETWEMMVATPTEPKQLPALT